MEQLKLGRSYSLSVQGSDGSTITIAPPFTLEFDITRTQLTSANVCQIKIYNLSAHNRNLLRFDFSNTGLVREVVLRAGYGTNLPQIFSGNITQAWSERIGTNYITTIECFDGGNAFVNGRVVNGAGPWPVGTPYLTILQALISDLPGVGLGVISPNYYQDASGKPYTTTREITYYGDAAPLLGELTSGGFYIDNGKAYILGNNQAFEGTITLINASTGLLGTPIREQLMLSFDMIFEPRLLIGQQINLQSTTVGFTGGQNSNSVGTNTNLQTEINGIYKVTSIKHRGIISPVVSGDAITTVGMFFGSSKLNLLENS